MKRPRRLLLPLVVLCGTVALASWGAARLSIFGSSGIEKSAIGQRGATRGGMALSGDTRGDAPSASAMTSVGMMSPTIVTMALAGP